jgi:hypothetical protein
MNKFGAIAWTESTFNLIRGDQAPDIPSFGLVREHSKLASRCTYLQLFGHRAVLGWTAFRKKLVPATSLAASKFSSENGCPPRTTGRPYLRSSR